MKDCETCVNWYNGDFSIHCVDCRNKINYKEDEKSVNYMPEVLKMLGVEVGEKFDIDKLFGSPFYFNEEYLLINRNGSISNDLIPYILMGNAKIEKIPWKPKEGEIFYYVSMKYGVDSSRWDNESTGCYYCYNAGNCFRTLEEITPEIKERILKEMKGKYENEN